MVIPRASATQKKDNLKPSFWSRLPHFLFGIISVNVSNSIFKGTNLNNLDLQILIGGIVSVSSFLAGYFLSKLIYVRLKSTLQKGFLKTKFGLFYGLILFSLSIFISTHQKNQTRQEYIQRQSSQIEARNLQEEQDKVLDKVVLEAFEKAAENVLKELEQGTENHSADFWIGDWSSENANISIKLEGSTRTDFVQEQSGTGEQNYESYTPSHRDIIKDTAIQFDGNAYSPNAGKYGPNMAFVRAELKPNSLEKKEFIVNDDNCTLIVKRSLWSIVIQEDQWCGGFAASFNGKYVKVEN